ncbi:MAG: response regulator [Deltaproteobacteria bacterium]|nr:response regulator [Deltaproteobacteria bacterium]
MTKPDKNVLIVDDEKPFLMSLSDGLAKGYPDKFNVLLAENGNEAVKILESNHIGLLVTDLKMPKMDGLELLVYMNSNYPSIPIIAMTAFGTPEIEDQLQSTGVFQYLEKPLDIDLLAESILEGMKAATKGYIQGITLPTLLQMVEMEKKTCTLKVMCNKLTGYLYLSNGELMDAEAGGVNGEEAAITIISWDKSEVEIEGICKKRRQINSSLSYILMETMRIKDEKQQAEKEKKRAQSLENKQENGNPDKGGITMAVLEEIIENFKMDIPDFLATDIVRLGDGMSIGGISSDPNIDSSAASAAYAQVINSQSQAAELLGGVDIFGEAEDILITCDKIYILLRLLGENHYHQLLLTRKANIGMGRLMMKKYEPRFMEALLELGEL